MYYMYYTQFDFLTVVDRFGVCLALCNSFAGAPIGAKKGPGDDAGDWKGTGERKGYADPD